MNSTRLITSELATRRARKALFTCVVYTNIYHCRIWLSPVLAQARTFCASNRIRTWLHPPPAHWRIENVCCLNPSFPIGKWDDENNHEIKKVWAWTHLTTPNPQVPCEGTKDVDQCYPLGEGLVKKYWRGGGARAEGMAHRLWVPGKGGSFNFSATHF